MKISAMHYYNLRIFTLYLFASLYSLSSLRTIHASFTYNSAGCVNPSGFDSCWSAATSAITNCYTKYCEGQTGELCTDFFGCQSSSSYCTNACFCVMYTSLINCALDYCWNEVYSCDYQQLVIYALQGCPTAKLPIPFFPAPENAPGGCSCDISQVYRIGTSAYTEQDSCNTNISNALNANQITPVQAANGHTDCACCAASFPVSVFYNLCPNTSPSQLTFFSQLIHVSSVASCASSLSSIDCTKNLGFTSPGWTDNSPWVDPNNLPANGTDALSNTAGSGTISAPLSGASFTWSLGAVTTVAVAVAGTASASASGGAGATTGGTGAGAGAGTGTGTTTGTATASAAGATGSKSSAAGAVGLMVRDSSVYGWVMAISSILAVLL